MRKAYEIDERWGAYDRLVAQCQLDDYGYILLDEYGCPIDDEYEVAELTLTKEDMWQSLLDHGVSDETLRVVTNINGYSEETMCDILYATTGYRDFFQMMDDEAAA